MSTLAIEIEKTLDQLSPERASAAERLFRDLLDFVRAEAPPSAEKPAVDAKGWPVGYWESVVGSLEGDDWEPSPDPPPEPCLEP